MSERVGEIYENTNLNTSINEFINNTGASEVLYFIEDDKETRTFGLYELLALHPNAPIVATATGNEILARFEGKNIFATGVNINQMGSLAGSIINQSMTGRNLMVYTDLGFTRYDDFKEYIGENPNTIKSGMELMEYLSDKIPEKMRGNVTFLISTAQGIADSRVDVLCNQLKAMGYKADILPAKIGAD